MKHTYYVTTNAPYKTGKKLKEYIKHILISWSNQDSLTQTLKSHWFLIEQVSKDNKNYLGLNLNLS